MNLLTPEFMQFLRDLFVVGTIIGGFVAGWIKLNQVSKTGEKRSKANADDITALKDDLKAEREARQAAVASIEEWRTKFAESENRIHILEQRITAQDQEIAAHKKNITALLEKNAELYQQAELERTLRLALQQRMDAEDGAMTKALAAVQQIVAPFIQLAVTNTQQVKAMTPGVEPIGGQPA